MEKQELKSKWDELARELGAEIAPEIERREEAASTMAEEAAPRQVEEPAATVRPPLPKRAADWDGLAGELGLPPVEPTQRAADEERPTVQQREAVHEPAARRPPQREQDDRRRPPTQRREPEQKRREPREPREPDQKRREKPAHNAGVSAESRSQGVPDAEAPPAEPARPREEPAKPAAVSLWNKIFGSPAEQSAKLTETPSAGPETGDGPDVREEPPTIARTKEIRSLSGEDVTAAGFVEELDRGDGSAFTPDDDSSAEHRRGRPRRRRRGGRGRKPDSRQTEERPAAHRGDRLARVEKDVEIDDDLPDSELEDEILGSDEGLDDTDIDDADDSEAGATSTHRSKAAQRTIPTWDEAIGYIVDANMQSRSQRRPPSRSDSRGNSSRGRSRGRRKN